LRVSPVVVDETAPLVATLADDITPPLTVA